MAIGIGIDVYGTLVDPLGMNTQLRPMVGELADEVAELWRAKQLKYTFRRTAMGRYDDFDQCTRQALVYVLELLDLHLSADQQDSLVAGYQRLEAYEDSAPALRKLGEARCLAVAFSNGVEATLRELLRNAGLLNYLHDVLSVDRLRTFKPDPRVYRYLAERLGRSVEETWLISSNSFDVIGAKAAGLRAAWIRRRVEIPLDPWDIYPDIVVRDLLEFAGRVRELG